MKTGSAQRRALVSVAVLSIAVGALLLLKLRGRWPAYARIYSDTIESIGDWARGVDQWIALSIISAGSVALLHRIGPARTIADLGLTGSIARGVLFGLVASLPMLIGYGVTGTFSPGWFLINMALIGPLVEEVFFRGFLYRQLDERAGWGFWPAAIVSGVIFGLAHLSLNEILALDLDANDLLTVLITGAGGVFYAWLFRRWGFNLWIVIALHAFMNLWWQLFSAGDGAVGGVVANICRALTIALAIMLTMYRDRLPLRWGREADGRKHAT